MRATAATAAAASAALLAAAAALLPGAPAPALASCPNGYSLPTLCNSPNQLVNPAVACGSQDYPFKAMAPCCRGQTEVPLACQQQLPVEAARCRSVTMGAASCPPSSENFCNTQEMKLTINIDIQQNNATCCSQCECYGDPHCTSFTGVPDSWVICDARNPSLNKGTCPMSEAVCVQQTDQLGRPCVWHQNANNAKWIVGKQGSPCYPGPSDTPPMMLMYSADNFSMTLTMGERSIISGAIIQDGPNKDQYILRADNCFSDPFSPWRVNFNDSQGPIDPSWLPYSFKSEISDSNADLMWSVVGLPSGIQISITCTRTATITPTGTTYSEPRLDIPALYEPENWNPALAGPGVRSRTNVGGFCASGKINTQGSTSNTDYIQANGLCQTVTSNLNIAQVLCNEPSLTQSGVAGCEYLWCTQARGANWQSCMSDIATYGWGITYCASVTIMNGTAAQCKSNNLCTQCSNMFLDEASVQSIVNLFGTTTISDVTCTPQSQLPSGFPSGGLSAICDGLVVEYESAPGQWTSYIAWSPSQPPVCGNQLVFDSQTDSVLFTNPVRVRQCSGGFEEGVVNSQCLVDACSSNLFGFSAQFHYEAKPSQQATIVDLYNEGVLICNPKEYPGNPTGCVSGASVAPTNSPAVKAPTVPMCPCPSAAPLKGLLL